MIIVHETFICKPGNASKLAKMFKEVMAEMGEQALVMTDMTGQYNKVIVSTQYNNLADFEKGMEMHMNPDEKMKKSMEKMQGYQEMYLTGSREIYRIW